MPRTSRETAPNVTQFEGVVDDRFEVLDGYHISFTSFESDVDGAPLLKGAPDDQCHCPHWGYVLKGRFGFRFGDREEIYEAGDAFYVAPGHTPVGFAGGEIVMFQPEEEMARTVEVMKRNMEAAAAAAPH
jgi:hypothetical protein